MKILITGAGSMLGTELSQALSGHKVMGIGRHKHQQLNIPYTICDLTQENAFARLCQKDPPEVIIHCAAMTQVDLCESERQKAYLHNVLATENVVEAANATQSLVIFFSTDYVFDGENETLYNEEAPAHPLNYYGETKLVAENYIRRHAKQYYIFRICWLFGFHNSCFPKTILMLAQKQDKLRIVQDQLGRPTSAYDVANGMKKLLEEKETLKTFKNQTFHLANDELTSWADYAEYVLKRAGKKTAVDRIPSTEFLRKAVRPKHAVLNIDKADQLLKLRLRRWPEAVDHYLDRLKLSEPHLFS